jgi:hypothetical protein
MLRTHDADDNTAHSPGVHRPLAGSDAKRAQRRPAALCRVAAIAEAARELVRLRDTWLNPAGADEAELKRRTLTNLYNQRPTWLDQAHRRLDIAVFDAYGWPYDLTDEQILERLLALNLERTGGVSSAASHVAAPARA